MIQFAGVSAVLQEYLKLCDSAWITSSGCWLRWYWDLCDAPLPDINMPKDLYCLWPLHRHTGTSPYIIYQTAFNSDLPIVRVSSSKSMEYDHPASHWWAGAVGNFVPLSAADWLCDRLGHSVSLLLPHTVFIVKSVFVLAVMLKSIAPFTPAGIVWPECFLPSLANTLNMEARASCIPLKV